MIKFLHKHLRAFLAGEEGFTMIAVMGILAAGMALSVAAFAAAGGDVRLSRNDEDQKRAYAAAEAGVQDYFFHLNQDNSYWAKCTTVTPAHPALNQKGASPLKTRLVPGSTASYAIELLPANGATACDPSNAEATMITATGQQSGTFSIRSTGFSNNVKRKIIATFRRRSFLDFLYFTDMETTDPAWYALSTKGNPTRSGKVNSNGSFTPSANPDLLSWAAANCTRYWRNGRGSQSYPVSPDTAWQQQAANGTWGSTSTNDVNCTEIQFVGGDTIQGPLHTNDDILVCGAPTFGRGPQDDIEVSGSGWRQGCGSGGPNIVGTWQPNSPVLTPPPSDTSLKQVADPNYVFKGQTTIVLNNGSMTVTNNNLSPTTKTLTLPSNGVVYVDYDNTAGCSQTAYQPLNPYGDDAGCADAYVKGTYSQDLTIGSAKDIVVNGNIARSGDRMLGLIANNFVRVYHPVNRDATDPTSCTNSNSTPTNISIDAAILALNHSFTVDNYYCGNPLGTLTVNGTIAQKFRGPVGRGSGSNIANGYLKDYEYDDRLRLREPPYFIDPVQAAWRIQRYAEQVG
ncbi:MAG TPA: pilus assembly PilX N-terminal domain-containing protein [Conexibacter sp.]|nr:pilus assembly PilX N-terminal domain-containing protein [Conexibacter sp.]